MAQFFRPKKNKVTNTKHTEFHVVRLDHQGDGIAFSGKKTVFITGALPGEHVIAQYIEEKRHYARAKLIRILTSSPDRVTPFCSQYAVCGGCQLQHLEHKQQISLKNNNLKQLMSGYTATDVEHLSPVIGQTKGYRRRARLSVNVDKSGQLQMGFRQRSRNEIVTVTHCPVLDSNIDTLLPSLYDTLNSLSGRHLIGHIEWVKAEHEVILLVRTTKPLHQNDIDLIFYFASENQISLYLEQGTDAPQRFLGSSPYYCIEDVTVQFEPKDFIQVNDGVNKKMVALATEWLALNEKDHVLDLFCGLGNFSLPIAKKVKQVMGIEGVEEMVSRARENAQRNNLNNVTFHHANLEDDTDLAVLHERVFNKILLDPARSGALQAIPFIAKLNTTHVLYVSCNPVTLARDSQQLKIYGYRLKRLCMLDMFPHTGHSESMALFLRD